MIKVLKRHAYLCVLTTSVFPFAFNIAADAQDLKASCGSLFKSYSCNNFEKVKGSFASKDISTSYEDNFDKKLVGAVVTEKSREIVIKPEKGLDSKNWGTLQLKGVGSVASEVVTARKVITILDSISVTGNGVNTGKSKEISGRNNGINRSVFGVQQGSFLFVKDGKVDVANVHALVGESAPAVFPYNGYSLKLQELSKGIIYNTNIVIKGHGTHGLHFQGGLSDYEYVVGELLSELGEFQFKKSTLRAFDGTAVYVDDSRRVPYITVSDGSRVSADLLLEVKNNSYAVIEANNSFLVGGARIDSNSYAELELSNKAQWTVTPRKNNNLWNGKSTDSSISFMRLVDSSVFFKKPQDSRYQVLRIGRLNDSYSDHAYVAHGDARLHVNASFSTDNQVIQADKVLIYGDVYGTTKVYVVSIPKKLTNKVKKSKGRQGRARGVSIIQVYGKATENSFKSPVPYITLKGSPYRYSLRAYGPGQAKNGRKDQVNGTEDFWDFRLEPDYIERVTSSRSSQNQVQRVSSRRRTSRSAEGHVHHNSIMLDSASSLSQHEEVIMAVVPQVPTYLLLPNAFFHAGLMDVRNQNKQLEALRVTDTGMPEIYENPALFLRGYGGNYRYGSDLSTLEYGYGGNLDYNGVEAGLLLKTIEDSNIAMSFGVMGSYGKLSLQPRDVEQSQKSAFDKWTAAAYGTVQHDEGFYVDSLFSYGSFKGDVLTLARGKTATLKGKSLSASLTSGKSIMTGHKGLVFDPQVQVMYQNLRFDKTSDVDGFDIDMGRLDKWIMRSGVRLTKTLDTSQEGRVVSFTGKMHFARGFGGSQSVHFEDAFQLGAFGSFLETGLGFNAQLSSKFAFHGDVTYQHQFGKAGFSGMSFSSSLRYRF
ncbi:outer membrane autotransporter protein [Bartonella japonica]|uniref:Outer membrane autotransporter protein n=1 Tax=Bartonella japonica TaxID=357761 RepID=A0ABV2FPP6_9HYPH